MTSLTEMIETVSDLVGMRNALALIQTAYAMAVEGTTRATATQIAEREASEYGYSTTPSNVGQVFAALEIKTATSHGKTRFVLDIKQLTKIRDETFTHCEELSQRLEDSLASYKKLDTHIKTLIVRLQEVNRLKEQEQDLLRQLGETE